MVQAHLAEISTWSIDREENAVLCTVGSLPKNLLGNSCREFFHILISRQGRQHWHSFRKTIDRSTRGRPLPKSIIDERNRLMNSMRAANDPLGRFHDRKRLGRIMVKVAKK
jgi:hypothetical protein